MEMFNCACACKSLFAAVEQYANAEWANKQLQAALDADDGRTYSFLVSRFKLPVSDELILDTIKAKKLNVVKAQVFFLSFTHIFPITLHNLTNWTLSHHSTDIIHWQHPSSWGPGRCCKQLRL